MNGASRFVISNILDEIENGDASSLEYDLSAFSCPANAEIETFLKNNAIEFAKRKLSITYLVTDIESGDLVAYFTLTHKAIDVADAGLSNTARKKAASYARLDPVSDSYNLSAFLLAQFGKNYAVDAVRRISGHDLMSLVYVVLRNIQRQIGGGAIFLDCDYDNPFLTDFYQNKENYRLFGERVSEIDNKRYLQFMRFL